MTNIPPPEGWPPYGPPPPYPYGPPPRSNDTALVVGLAVVGAFVYFLINFIAGLVVLILADSTKSQNAVIAVGAVLLAVLAFGGGGGLLAVRKPWAKGLGLGLMIGWALTSLVTVGFCTGLNPELYGSL